MISRLTLRAVTLLGFFLAVNAFAVPAVPPAATYRIAGIVVDSVTGQPLDGTEVTVAPLQDMNDAQSLMTSDDGRFLFAGLAPGKYSLLASRRGYASQALDQHESFWTSIVVGPRLDSEHIRFPLAPSSVITGVVTDDWGDPVRDAKVLLFQQSTFDGSRTLRNVNQTTTDDQGRYRFAHLLSGTYAVAVFARPWYTKNASPLLLQTLTNLQSIASSGAQVEPGASEASHASVAEDTSQPPLAQLFDVVYPVTFFPSATSLADAGRLALAPGATETADFQLHAVPSVHLRVRVPVEPPATVVSHEGGEETATQEDSPAAFLLSLHIGDYTDQIEPVRNEIAPGVIELSKIPSGEVNLVAMSLTSQAGNEVSRSKELRVSGDTDIDLSAPGDSANVSGVVLASQFHPAPTNAEQASADQPSGGRAALIRVIEEASPNVTITFRSIKTGESYSATVSSEGKFSFAGSTFPAGSYEVEFPAQTSLRVVSLEATGATASGRTIDISAGLSLNLVVHAAEANCTLSGFALKNGKPVAGAMVLLVPQDPGHDMSLYHRDQSDSDGSFSMSPLFPGRYLLLAIENGWDLEWADPAILFRYLPNGQPVDLAPAASLSLNAKVQ